MNINNNKAQCLFPAKWCHRYHSFNKHCARWYKYSGEVIQPQKDLCLGGKFSIQKGNLSPFLVTDSESVSFAQSSAQHRGGWAPSYLDYQILSRLLYESYMFLIVLRGCSKCAGALESDSPGLRSSSSTSYWHVTWNKLPNLSKAQFLIC